MIKRKELIEALSDYKVQGTAFLVLAPHKVETSLTYVDLPDIEVCEYLENHNHILAKPEGGQSEMKTVVNHGFSNPFVEKSEDTNSLNWLAINTI